MANILKLFGRKPKPESAPDAAGALAAFLGGFFAGEQGEFGGAAVAAGGAAARRVVVLTFGTGIGSALFLDGELWPNTELGHLMLPGVTEVDGEGYAAASVRTRLALDWPAWTQRVNRYLHELHRLLWPDVFILGGAVSERAEEWMPLLESPARLLPAALRGHAGVVGAAWAAATDRMAR